jgi:hypothetical protein
MFKGFGHFKINIRYICQNISSVTTYNEKKITKLLNSIKPDTVVLASWLEGIGISRDLQKHYRNSGWLESMGRGAFKRPGETVDWQGGLYALQYQAKLNVHVGAITALSLLGFSHYFRLSDEKIFLFTIRKMGLPKWFLNHNWSNQISQQQTAFLPMNIGIVEHEEKNFSIQISSPERAMFECLYLAPDTLDLIECFHLMESLTNLRPKLVQELLQNCGSIKVKRLFLYLSEKANHSWLQFIDISSIDIGNGNRRITEGGTYVAKYQITIPNELVIL